MLTRRVPVLALGLLLTAPAAAQDDGRSLHWAELRVEARLDDTGRLHVREHHGMVFTGEWNGGQLEVDTRLGQTFRFEGISRRVPETGALRPLVEDDDLEEVDQYERDGSRLRWRSRLPDDQPFTGDRIEYVVDYVVANAVLHDGNGYLLDRDFLPADRDGPVERFSLTLTLDEAWSTEGDFTGSWRAVDIPPGRGFAVRVPLRFERAGMPETVLAPPSGPLRWLVVALLAAGSLLVFLSFYRRERAARRYAPLPEVVDEAWLREHVLSLPPEVVGAAWDRETGAAEVAGLLARLVLEGRLASHVEADPDSDPDDPVLHLELRVPREAFDGHERALIDALFFDGREETDTQTIKEHYEKTGFDPASKISPAIEEQVDALGGTGMVPRRWGAVWVAFAVGTALLIAAVIVRTPDALPATLGFLFIAILGGVAMIVAASYAQRVTGLRSHVIGMAVPLGLMVGGLVAFVGGALEASTPTPNAALSPYYHPGPLLLVALLVLGLAMVTAVVTVARSTDTPERLALRRKLAAAEAYFRQQLDRPDPDLSDDWFPYLLAFGLGKHIDRWFTAYGPDAASAGAAAAVLASTTGGSASGSASGSGAGTSAWTGGGATFGGGGGFSGGGVGGSWSTAAGTIATGVSSPSSGGTGAGVASSGGGSAGGW